MNKTYLTDYLHYNAAGTPHKLALVDEAREISWQQLSQEVEAASKSLRARLRDDTQQVVAFLMPNGWQFVVTYLAIVKAGHIGMPIDVIYKDLEIASILDGIKPKLLITAGYEGRLPRTGIEIIGFEDLLADRKAPEPLRLPADKQIASLVFTSGTTGKPKAAPYTHASHIWNIKACGEAWQWPEDETLLINLPLSHWYGLCMGVSGMLVKGNTMYLQERFDAKKTLETLSGGKISHFTHIPLGYTQLLQVEGDYDLSSVRVFISGSAALPPTIWQAFKDRFGHEIIECYGSSETGRIASNTLAERLPGSPGRPLAEVKTKLSHNQELLVSSPGLFPGYWNNPAATQQSLLTDGWWNTGDIAAFKEGRVMLKGRSQESIRKQGYHISPRDIEWALMKNPGIRDAFVLGVQQPGNLDDNLVYFLVSELDEAQVQNYTQEYLPSVWRPDRVVFLDQIPRTHSGKPQLPKLRAMI